MPEVRVRPLVRPAEFEACVEVQRRVWGHHDLDTTPVHQFCVAVHTGSILLGAFAGRELAGYVYSFPAVFNGRRSQHSHHLAVLPEHQGLGLGKKLKWAQREEALRRGCGLITWTYDPMMARNANLNLHALGAEGNIYLRDFYGRTPALTLDEGVPTDRLLVEWRIRSRRVEERARKEPPPLHPADLPKAVERKGGGVFPDIVPSRPRPPSDAPRLLVEVPRSVAPLPRGTGVIAAWQSAIRSALERSFARGYRLDDFVFGDPSFYVLRKGRASS
ncbi:MAG: GNAT family N-acetyltransferase [Candidatus Aminicenantes bacterium]|nr:GNAT family N-acetyltransferase [Candidatus Aminicenantes bacterium]